MIVMRPKTEARERYYAAGHWRDETIFDLVAQQVARAPTKIAIKDASGKVENWSFQTYAPITLRRAGNDRQLFVDNIGKEVWVRGCLARNGTSK